MNQHVNLTFSLKYLVNFSKSASLSNVVQLMMSNDVPLLVRVHLLMRMFNTDLTPHRCHTSSVRGTSGTTLRLKSETTKLVMVLLVPSVSARPACFRMVLLCLSTRTYVSSECNLSSPYHPWKSEPS